MLHGVAVAVTAPAVTLWPRRRQGATRAERTRAMAGDGLVARPMYQTTRAIDIDAPPSAVWAWLIQIGQGRGGFYSFDRLENLAGMRIESADRIVPDLQHLAVGDVVPVGSLGGPTVVTLDTGTTLVLHYVMDLLTGKPVERDTPGRKRWLDWTWTFALRPIDRSGTRLVVRVRADYAPRRLRPLMSALLTPIHAVMERAMLRGIRRRAELVVRAPPLRVAPIST